MGHPTFRIRLSFKTGCAGIGDGTLRCGGDQGSVFGVDTATVDGRLRNALVEALLEGCGIDIDFDLASGNVNVNDVAFVDGGDGTAERGFGGDMARHEAASGAAETSIGDERDSASETLADDGGSNSKHLSHAGATLGTFIADDDYVSGVNGFGGDGVHGFFFTFKDTRRASVAQTLMPADLGDATFGGDIAAKDDEATGPLERLVCGDDYLLAGSFMGGSGFLGDGLAGDGDGFAVEQAER